MLKPHLSLQKRINIIGAFLCIAENYRYLLWVLCLVTASRKTALTQKDPQMCKLLFEFINWKDQSRSAVWMIFGVSVKLIFKEIWEKTPIK